MDIEDSIKDLLEKLLTYMKVDYSKLTVEEEENRLYKVSVESTDTSILIGHHGENLQALQHILKILTFRKTDPSEQFHIYLDIDGYREKQEESAINMADRKVSMLRKTRIQQSLPPMPAYLRRKVHLHLMGSGYDDIETFSKDEGEERHIVIKLKGR